MVNRLLILTSFVLFVILLAAMNFTTPTDAGPLGVLLFFTTLYIMIFCLAAVVVSVFFKIKGRKKPGAKGYAYAGILALAPIILLVMRPFMGLSLSSIALTMAFVGVGWFIISKIA